MPATAIRTTRLTGTTVDKVPISKNLGVVFSEREASLKEIAELEELKNSNTKLLIFGNFYLKSLNCFYISLRKR